MAIEKAIEKLILTKGQEDYLTLRSLGCPDEIAIRAIRKVPGEVYTRTDVRRADECYEHFLERTNPARYAKMMQERHDASAYKHGLAMAKRIGEQVRRDIQNEL